MAAILQRRRATRPIAGTTSGSAWWNGYRPKPTAIAVTFTGPLFITALAPFVLGEYVGWRRWIAVLIGFAGVLFMVRPGYGDISWVVLFPLGAALCGSIRDLITRRLSQTETTVAVLMVTTSAVIIAAAATLPFAWAEIKISDLGFFAASGMLVAGGLIL